MSLHHSSSQDLISSWSLLKLDKISKKTLCLPYWFPNTNPVTPTNLLELPLQINPVLTSHNFSPNSLSILNRHKHFPKKTILCNLIFLIPSPTWTNELLTFFKSTKWNLHTSILSFHKKFLKQDFSSEVAAWILKREKVIWHSCQQALWKD